MILKTIIAGLFALLAQPGLAQIVVSPDGEIKSIKQAVEMAEPGAHILVEPGTYMESDIGIDKPLTLEGIDYPLIDGNSEGFIFVIAADSVTIKGFNIKRTGRSYVRDYAAIMIEGVKDFIIEDNRLEDVFFGIYLAETEGGVVRNNRVEAFDTREASSGNGIHLWSVKNPKIIDNEVMGMRDGIYLEFVDNAEIYGNTSNENNRYGLHYMFSDGGRYYDNIFRRNGAGVAVMYSDNVDMMNNLFEHNWGTAAYGLLLKDINYSKIEGNRFYRNTVAIYSEGTNEVHIHGNDIELNGWAVNIKSNSARNQFTENNFIENSFDVRTDSPRNNNEFEGNYWSQYEGYDLDRDGIGDVPYRPVSLFSMVITKQPESLILLRSMFIKLLDTAERIAPVLTPKTLYDENPKMDQIVR
ncbi:nitrous oxide reductase family maturation protein NosD [Rhodohalobacter barkolensis]|uniref:Nitrous oxide reductase family maturation protein NosD n=1 Tax=Rhodohalobacter barkolensis TaxID=2053187 RepID=A0A2N0VEZ5_9BACT|nr:nitrous oxide reductase family maturation protein NosD [Rhodohalobacter barkolensis]PKD42767.1 nitrous oxide reductase family maturation protein NosD [Rhodohalobacter barkolensis]